MRTSACPCCASPAEDSANTPAYTQCRQCGHRWRVPVKPTERQYYETLVARNDPHTPWFKRKIAERTAALIPLLIPRVRRILEVGCAEGELGRAIKAHSPLVYDGVELSKDAELARTKLDQVFRTPVDQLDSAPYELIVSFHVLEHIADPGQELQAWAARLAPEGTLLIEVPNQAGHPLLANDLNPEHLHQFSPASLAVLLASQGFSIQTLSLRHYESPVYPDSIRVLAQRQFQAERQQADLLQRFRARLPGPCIAYGIGGDFLNYVAPVAEYLEIQALVDSAPGKRGLQFGRYQVEAYDPEHHGAVPILICSIKFGANIRQQLLSMGVAPELIIGLEEIYEAP